LEKQNREEIANLFLLKNLTLVVGKTKLQHRATENKSSDKSYNLGGGRGGMEGGLTAETF
jgi:hypothetical protein